MQVMRCSGSSWVLWEWLCRGGRGGGGGAVTMVAVFGGGGRRVVGVGAVGSGAVAPVHPLGGGGPGGRRAGTGPALAGARPGPGRRRPRRRSPRLSADATGALVEESSGAGRWTGTGHRGGSGPRVSPPPRPLRAQIARPGALAALLAVRLLVAQPTMRRENRPRDEGGAARTPRRVGTRVTRVKSTARRRPAPGGGSRGACGPPGALPPGARQPPAPRCAGPPSAVVPGRSPPTDPNPPAGSRPRRIPGPAPGPFAHAPQTPPRPVRVGQGAPASTRSHSPGSSGRLFRGWS